MKLTREDLVMMLDKMNNCGADYIEVTPNYDDYLGYTEDIDFDLITLDHKRNCVKFREIILTID
jgi:hypothetical protein